MEAGKAERSSGGKEGEEVILPGFRFHPTDEELVGFYLRRKVENKPISIEFIKQIDIYKYDPWDLPKSSVGEKEKYFFCKRGRKYKNSTRPNRGTGSGFWKATGIDRPVASTRELHGCIGLKKSLVYYIGTAGKGSKTNWMMHEFRLPPHPQISNLSPQEAEVWTLCRIFKRIPNHRKYPSSLKGTSSSQSHPSANPNPNPNPDDSGSSKSNSFDSESSDSHLGLLSHEEILKSHEQVRERNSILARSHESSSHEASSSTNNLQSFWNSNSEDFFSNTGWDELRPVVRLAFESSTRFI